MKYYSYDDFKNDIQQLTINLQSEQSTHQPAYRPDAIIAIARGGLTIAHFLGIALNIREVFTINAISYFNKKQDVLKISHVPTLNDLKQVLIVDDIVDSGKSMQKVCDILQEMNPDIHFKSLSIFYKPTAIIKPDFYLHEAQEWIEFFWEVDPSNQTTFHS